MIKKAKAEDAAVLALLGLVTYNESHGQFIENKEDLKKYNEAAFSISKTKKDIQDRNNVFYIIYSNDVPAGYAKLVLNTKTDGVTSNKNCQLERIYILQEFIPLKISYKLLVFLEKEAHIFGLDTIWLSVYVKNLRAIKFYQKHDYKNVGKSVFLVNGKGYENMVFSKTI
jgi:GNAT superfamily N-acetyltransferase